MAGSDSAIECVAGIDGGGSKTSCLLATLDGTPLGEGTGGPANYQTVGEARTLAALAEVTAAAAGEGPPIRVVALCLALAGVDRPEDLVALRRVVETLLARSDAGLRWDVAPDRVVIVNDAVAALVGGTGRTSGIVCVAGTGSIAFGMNRAGERRRTGGWGHLLGDEGSGYALGLAAVRAVCRACDGRGPTTALTDLVLRHCGVPDPTGLVGLAYGTWGPSDVAALAPLVGSASTAGDAVAGSIVDEAATELALATFTVAGALDMRHVACEVVAAGGLWAGVPRLRDTFTRRIHETLPEAEVITPRASPVAGAVLLARQATGAITLG
jgi:N-acetylglucosamine kinase